MTPLVEYAAVLLRQPGSLLVIDIDGTLAFDTYRSHLRPASNSACLCACPVDEIERYMSPDLVRLDEKAPGARPVVARLLEAADHTIIATSRWERLRGVTETWLADHFPELLAWPLLMRPDDATALPSADVKVGAVMHYRRNIAGLTSTAPAVWLDDDDGLLGIVGKGGFLPLRAPDVYR